MSDSYIVYLTPNKFTMLVLGLWPYQPAWQRFLTVFIHFTIFIIVTLPTYTTCYRICMDPTFGFVIAPSVVVFSMNIFLYILFVYHFSEIKKLYQQIEKYWENVTCDFEKKILEKYAISGRGYLIKFIGYFAAGIVYVAIGISMPRILDFVAPLNQSRPLVGSFYYDYSIYRMNLRNHFYVIWLFHIVVPFMTFNDMCAYESTFFIFINHICGLFATLGHKLEYGGKDENANYKHIERGHFSKHFSECVKFHQEILDFTKTVESLFSLYWLLKLGMVVLTISIYFFVLSFKKDMILFMKFIQSLSNMTVILFMSTRLGEKLIERSLLIQESIYNSMWYSFSARVRSVVMMIQLRSNKPCVITACTIFTVQIKVFKDVLQTCMSYYTVLSAINE